MICAKKSFIQQPRRGRELKTWNLLKLDNWFPCNVLNNLVLKGYEEIHKNINSVELLLYRQDKVYRHKLDTKSQNFSGNDNVFSSSLVTAITCLTTVSGCIRFGVI